MMLLSIGQAARRWESIGKMKSALKTIGGHRRYAEHDVNARLTKSKRINICYARVSSHDQKSDLETQVKFLENHCAERNIPATTIQDLGSGLNFKKKGLNRLISLILNQKVDTVYVSNKDRLLRFGSELLVTIARHFGTTIHFVNDCVHTFEQALARDVLEIITVFSAKLYGARSHKKQQALMAA
jgi:predicted site-specific integrase-resolvase